MLNQLKQPILNIMKYQLLPPKFKFALFLLELNKFKSNQQTGQATICHADIYEIQTDGSIIFYQTGLLGDKKVKVPVLVYPQGKWEACVLMDDNNSYPVFNGKGHFDFSHIQNTHSHKQTHTQIQTPTNNNNSNSEGDDNSNNHGLITSSIKDGSDDLDDLADFLGGNTGTANNTHNTQNQHYSSQQNPNVSMPGLSHNNINNANSSMPGVAQNTAEFKKAKSDYLEAMIKDYVKSNTMFDINAFQTFVNKDSKGRALKINETDIEWTSSNLIREKSVLARKFSDPTFQKTLALILPDIMRRQWSGKMGPILQILQDREETKNANAIDLAVWMSQNNFE